MKELSSNSICRVVQYEKNNIAQGIFEFIFVGGARYCNKLNKVISVLN